MVVALNQAQVMRQQGEDDTQTDKAAIAKACGKSLLMPPKHT
jgi:hypothetical protein